MRIRHSDGHTLVSHSSPLVLQSVPYPLNDSIEGLATSPLLNVIKEGKVDLVINAGSAANSAQPSE